MVNLTKRTGRHQSYRPTLTKAGYVPRHDRGDYVVTALRSGRFVTLNV